MSSPAYLGLCCFNGTQTNRLFEKPLLDSNVDIACLTSASISLVGIVYLLLPRYDEDLSKTLSTSQTRILASSDHVRRIIHYIIFSDVLACLGVFARSVLKITSNQTLEICVFLNIWIQFFYLATYFWNLSYGVELVMNLRHTGNHWIKYLIGVVIPMLLCPLQVIFTYFPHRVWCLQTGYEETIVYVSAYLPIGVVIILNPLIFYFILKSVRHLLIRQLGKFAKHERDILEAAKLKFLLIMLVYVFCWFPNLLFLLLQAFHLSDLPVNPFLVLAYLQGVVNPLQAVCNCVVFRGWPGFLTSCSRRVEARYSQVEDFQESLEFRINSLSCAASPETEPILNFRQSNRHRYS